MKKTMSARARMDDHVSHIFKHHLSERVPLSVWPRVTAALEEAYKMGALEGGKN